ncbi:hypothetical protein [Paenibacillus wenxiniae]|uniref:hypothetical protein n=1 Tax=Paenibacillus wenxiniae TaxID=1636843 RepID=UPI003221F9CE
MSGVWCLVSGVWCLVSGVWCLVSGVWCLVSGQVYDSFDIMQLYYHTVLHEVLPVWNCTVLEVHYVNRVHSHFHSYRL